jgi:Glyoxalase-like domain
MVFWQLTIDANDPARLARFWEQALGYQPVPPTVPATTWNAHYRRRLGDDAAFDNRLFDPAGVGPALWSQEVPDGNPTNQEPTTSGAHVIFWDHDSWRPFVDGGAMPSRGG